MNVNFWEWIVSKHKTSVRHFSGTEGPRKSLFWRKTIKVWKVSEALLWVPDGRPSIWPEGGELRHSVEKTNFSRFKLFPSVTLQSCWPKRREGTLINQWTESLTFRLGSLFTKSDWYGADISEDTAPIHLLISYSIFPYFVNYTPGISINRRRRSTILWINTKVSD